MNSEAQISLDQLAPGAMAVVRALRGGAGFTSRLAGIGISAGCRVEVLQNAAHGPLLVRVRGTRIALGRGEAAKILVTELAGEQADADA